MPTAEIFGLGEKGFRQELQSSGKFKPIYVQLPTTSGCRIGFPGSLRHLCFFTPYGGALRSPRLIVSPPADGGFGVSADLRLSAPLDLWSSCPGDVSGRFLSEAIDPNLSPAHSGDDFYAVLELGAGNPSVTGRSLV